jgi:dihydroneopterin aldolase
VSISDLRVSAVIGVFDWERETEQTLTFAIEMPADVASAAATDDLNDALDYSKVAEAVREVVTEGKFQLIETAAERVADRLLADFALPWLKLDLAKPITADGYTAKIHITRPALSPASAQA